jgi:U3 small nucleolar RNA-associated protein 18
LFFFDAGPVAAPAGSVAPKGTEESDDEDEKPAWEDSDDERLVVSLASVPQLRKLRETADDDVVNGKEYSRRLRKQYERLYPTPNWAAYATGKANKKRRRTMEEDESGDESASDMDVDDEDLSTAPLAKLLKDADILSRVSRGSAKRRKLQAGTIDIQRLKDVSKAGPVSRTSSIHDLIIANSFYSLPLPLCHSTLLTHYCFHPDPAQHCTFTTSIQTRRTQILY